MDRALKERIIGAVVLVVIVVLVVPVFLDGPARDPDMISETVTLPGQNSDGGARKTVVLELDRDQPLPESSARNEVRPAAAAPAPPRDEPPTAAAEPRTQNPASTRSEPEPEPETPPARKETPPPEAAPDAEPATRESATGMWAVQMGSFSNKGNADRLAASLRESGYAAFLSQLDTASGRLHRVRIGPQKDRASAEAVAEKLGAEGLKGQVVPHP
jgi:DedD protein